MPRISLSLLHLAVAFLMAMLGFAAQGAPYIPNSDGQVLERLPLRPNDPVAREMLQLRKQLRADPDNVDVATALARRYYEMVAEEGDPRYLGYAQWHRRYVGKRGTLCAMQIFWPDKAGLFPWEMGCDRSVALLQPRLDLPRPVLRREQ